MSDHTTRRAAEVQDTLDAIDTAVDGYITWDGDSADAMEWFAPEHPAGRVLYAAINGVDITDSILSVEIRDGIDGDIVAAPEFEPATYDQIISTMQAWNTTVAVRPPKPRGWRGWMHRLGLVRSPHCTLFGIPFGFRRRKR